MQKAEITGAGAPLKIVTCDVPSTPSAGVRVKVTHAGICHTDLHFIKDKINLGDGKIAIRSENLTKRGLKFEGIVPGHEIAGTVDDIGPDVKGHDFKVGDRVAVYPWIGCENCDACFHGFNNMCDECHGGTTDYGLGPNSGGYGSHVIVNDPKFVLKVPDEVPMSLACMLPCSALSAYMPVTKTKRYIQHGASVRGKARLLVIGAGGLGLWAIKLAPLIMEGLNLEIIAADVGIDKLELAIQNGAHHTILWETGDDVATMVNKVTNNGKSKLDASIDFVGMENTVLAGARSLHKGGTLVMVGQAGGMFKMPTTAMIFNLVAVQGNRTGPLPDLKDLIHMAAKHNVTYPNIEETKHEDINKTLDRLRSGQVKGRAIIKY